MSRFKRKGRSTKSVDSDIHIDQDNISSLNNGSEKDSKVMEKMTQVKKSKNDETQIEGKK